MIQDDTKRILYLQAQISALEAKIESVSDSSAQSNERVRSDY